MRVLITGVAGFIGYHVASTLLDEKVQVYGVDSMCSEPYGCATKIARLHSLMEDKDNFAFAHFDIRDTDKLRDTFQRYGFTHVIHLAGEGEVEHAFHSPMSFISANISSLASLLDCCADSLSIEHILIHSSGDVYGNEKDRKTFAPVSLYGASNRSYELIARSFSSSYPLPITSLRFFDVYGEWGRVDAPYYQYVHNILSPTPKPIFITNRGLNLKSYVYVGDVVRCVLNLLDKPPSKFRMIDIGNPEQATELYLLHAIETEVKKKFTIRHRPSYNGEILNYSANMDDYIGIARDKKKFVPIDHGMYRFIRWYKDNHASFTGQS